MGERRIACRALIVTGGALAAIGGCGSTPLEPPPPKQVDAAVSADTRFGLALYRQLAHTAPGANLFVSPYSVANALAIAREGARSSTAAQMTSVLAWPEDGDPAGMRESAAALSRWLDRERDGVELTVANALWCDGAFPLAVPFVDTVTATYGARLANVSFAGDPEAARRTINGWVNDTTRGRIDELMPSGSVDPLTRLVITNAIWFKGDWAEPFDPKHTREQSFTRLDGTTVQVPLMSRREKRYPFASLEADGTPVADQAMPAPDGFKLLEMPYRGETLSMLVILPDRADGLADLERRLSAERLAAWTGRLRETTVNLSFPRFRLETRHDLKPALKALGMVDAFSETSADFTGLSDSAEAERLSITSVVHKAFVAVDEKGTEAAAATGVVFGATSVRLVPEFRADHPFLFLIRDRQTGAVLFLGRVTEPGG